MSLGILSRGKEWIIRLMSIESQEKNGSGHLAEIEKNGSGSLLMHGYLR